MKNLLKYILIAGMGVAMFSCKKDNYAPPSIQLNGNLVYNGEHIEVEANQVPYLIYQYGFGKVGPIGSLSIPNDRASITPTFAEDGSYSQVLFAGTYKMVIPNGQGPFMWKQTSSGGPDTVTVDLKSNQTVDFDVTPYYLIHNAQISNSGGKITATFKIDKIITDANAKDIESVSLFINQTQFVSGNTNIARTDLSGNNITNPASVSLSVNVPSIVPTPTYVYARVGLKISNVEDMIFSPLVKVDL